MTRSLRLCLGFAAVFVLGWNLIAAESDDLSEYRTTEKAITTRITKGATMAVAPKRSGFLGVHVAADDQGRLTIAEVAVNSPAARAGVQRGDLVLELDGQTVRDEDTFYDMLGTKYLGDAVKLALSRQDQRVNVSAVLEPLTRPLAQGRQKALLGVQVATVPDGQGVKIERVEADSPAERARLKIDEVILKVDDTEIPSPEKLNEVLAGHQPDDTVTLTLFLADKSVEMKVRLGAEPVPGAPAGGPRQGFGAGRNYWTRPTYRLGIILVEYPDVKHNPTISPQAWEESMFAKGTYTKSSVTGQQVYGSMYDYYLEQSYGALKIEGKAFDYVTVSKRRNEYGAGATGGGGGGGGGRGGGNTRTAMLTEAMNLILKRDGPNAFDGLDGVFFIYAGGRPGAQVAPRGSLYWPHRSSVNFNGRNWPYFICPEGGERMTNISVFCHEFGHMLGLPDLYARPENPGMEGSGIWSAMANQAGNGRPQHFCAWSKEKLGWIKPAVIDPRVKQKLILSPINDSPTECYKVLLRPDGREYLLLENRARKGFDASLPADGLLIWRVVGNRPTLEESHGVEGPAGPRSFLTSVPFPSPANNAFTPFTTPSSRSQLGPGGWPVYITNVTRLPDGRITFHIGYEYH